MDEMRLKGGKRAAIVGVGANIFLTLFNVTIGIISGSYALISEGAHTLSDILTSIIAYIGFRIGQKPADHKHPGGHGRAEAIAGLVITIFLVLIGYEIITGAIRKLLNPQIITIPNYLAIVMASIGIVTNIIISTYIIHLGKKINSPAIIADGQHQRVDVFSSVAIVLGVIISQAGYPIFDPIIGLFIGIMIFKTAFNVCKTNIDNIMGKIPSEELIDDIKYHANTIPEVCGAHNIRIDNFGAYATVSFHIELDGDLKLVEAHEIVHKVQNNIIEKIDIVKEVTVHACPCGVKYDHRQEIDK